MLLWCDKYRPTTLSTLDYGHDQAKLIKNLVKSPDFPHLLVVGPPGAGKRTRVQCLLRELFGSGVEKQRIEHQIVETTTRKKIEVKVIASNYHMEITPSDAGFYDRVVIQEMIKQHASVSTLQVESTPMKVVIVSEAEKLSREAQQALRRTMEKYMSTCRLVLISEQVSRIIPAIRSRTLMIRVPLPEVEVVASVVSQIAEKEGLKLSDAQGMAIANASERNLRRALMMAESMKAVSFSKPPIPHWLTFIECLAKKICQKTSGLDEIRNDLFQLLGHMIPVDVILRYLVHYMIRLTDRVNVRSAIIDLASFYDHRLRNSSKQIIHLEAFAAHVMLAVKTGNN